MSGKIEYGVVSFCPDLTDPDAQSTHVAVIGLLRNGNSETSEEVGGIFMIARADFESALPIEDDHLSRAVLSDLPDFLSEQVQEGLQVVGPDGLVPWIEHTLRNSLHISDIGSSNIDTEIHDFSDLMNHIAEIIRRVFDEPIPEEPFGKARGQRLSEMYFPNMQLWDPSSLENKGTVRSPA